MIELTTQNDRRITIVESHVSGVREMQTGCLIYCGSTFHDVKNSYDEVIEALGAPSAEQMKRLRDATGYPVSLCQRLLSWKDLDAQQAINTLTRRVI